MKIQGGKMTNLKSILAQFTQDKNTDYETQYVNLGSYINENFEALCQELQGSRFNALTVESKKAALFHAFEEQLVQQACQTAEQIDFLKQIEDNINPYLPSETNYLSIISYESYLKQPNERRAANFEKKCKWLKAIMEIEQLQASNHKPVITPPEDTQQFSIHKCLELAGVAPNAHHDILALEQFYQHLDTFIDTHFTDLTAMISDESFAKLQDKHQKVIFLEAMEASLIDYTSNKQIKSTTQDKNFKNRCHNLAEPKNYPYAQARADRYRDCSLNERKLMFIQKVQEEFNDNNKKQGFQSGPRIFSMDFERSPDQRYEQIHDRLHGRNSGRY